MLYKLLFVFALLAASVEARPYTEEQYVESFLGWAVKFKKGYANRKEEMKRFGIFKDNMDYIYNWRPQPGSDMRLKINWFADWTLEEFNKQSDPVLFSEDDPMVDTGSVGLGVAPASCDWSTGTGSGGACNRVLVTPVKDSGATCQATWAFATIGALEGAHMWFNLTDSTPLSDQQALDCCGTTATCSSGPNPRDCWNTLKPKGSPVNGVNSAAQIPWTGSGKSPVCTSPSSSLPPYARLSGNNGWTTGTVANNAEDRLKTVVGDSPGWPAAVIIDGSHPSYMFYASGVYVEPSCSSTSVTRGMVVVGYGTDPTSSPAPDYWILKNSIGTTWGEFGYMRLARNYNNHCGAARNVAYVQAIQFPSDPTAHDEL